MMQRVNEYRCDPVRRAAQLKEGRAYRAFCCKVYAWQHEYGRKFLHEHPDGAASSDEQCIRDLLRLSGVRKGRGDQCPFDQRTVDANGPG